MNNAIRDRARHAILTGVKDALQREFPYHQVEQTDRANATVSVELRHPTHMPEPIRFTVRITATEAPMTLDEHALKLERERGE